MVFCDKHLIKEQRSTWCGVPVYKEDVVKKVCERWQCDAQGQSVGGFYSVKTYKGEGITQW